MAWATIDNVEEITGITADARMQTCLEVANVFCARQRPDLPAAGPVPADVTHAVALYAAALYRQRSTGGNTAFTDFDQVEDQTTLYTVRLLLGSRKPVAR